MKLPPLSLYVHFPWCVRKCPYCDFNSHTAGARDQTDRYVEALIRDVGLEAATGRAGGREIATVFLGGGTPSLFSPGQIGRLLEATDAVLPLSSRAEITMEANPGSVEHGSLADYRAAGISRLSLGAQSFDDGMLKRLGRIHGSADIVTAFEEASSAAFDSINLDLMFALPGQNTEMALVDIRRALELSPPHISWYQLTLEPNTVFYSRPPADLPDEDTAWCMQLAGLDALNAGGLEQYEISAFARSGHRCRHNLNYWQFGDYLAVGAGAHGKVTFGDGTVRRYRKPAHPATYMQRCEAGDFDEPSRQVEAEDLAFEYMLNALRLPAGFEEADFARRTGLQAGVLTERLRQAEARGLIEPSTPAAWKPTTLGLRFLNDLQACFLPPVVEN